MCARDDARAAAGDHGADAADATNDAINTPHAAPATTSPPTTTHARVLDAVRFDSAGLVPAVAQDAHTGRVLMLAYMDRAALAETLQTRRAVYYSRSRRALWRKGDTSGQVQHVHDVILDCDSDAVLLRVEQVGVACHTGRATCFYRRCVAGADSSTDADALFEETEPVQIDPARLYR